MKAPPFSLNLLTTMVSGWCIFIYSCLSGQTIQLSPAPFNSVCQESYLDILIDNNSNQTRPLSELTLLLPCGIRYIPGSAEFATETANISPINPEFRIKALNPNEKINVRIRISGDCTTYECIDTGNITEIKASWTSAGSLLAEDRSPIEIYSSFLVITQFTPLFQTTSPGNAVTQRIKIRNTRPGRLSDFIIQQDIAPGFTFSSSSGQFISNANGKMTLKIGPAEISKTGNMDAFLDLNEEITIEINVTPMLCELKGRNFTSFLYAGWGCNQQICQKSDFTSGIKVLDEFDDKSVLEIEALGTDPDCRKNGEAIQRLKVNMSAGLGDAFNFYCSIRNAGPDKGVRLYSFDIPFVHTISYGDSVTTSCGQKVCNTVNIHIPLLQAPHQDTSFFITWRTAHCENEICDPKVNSFSYNYQYIRACAPPDKKLDTGRGIFAGSGDSTIISSQIIMTPTSNISNGSRHTIEYRVRSEKLKIENGLAEFCLILPRFMSVDENQSFAVGSTLPVQIFSEEVTQGRRICLSYSLPLPSDDIVIPVKITGDCSIKDNLVCKDTLLTSCPSLCERTTDIKLFNAIGSIYSFNEFCDAPITTCTSGAYTTECFDGLCPDTLTGYLNYNVSIRRQSLGLPDKNNDGIPDPDGIYNNNQLRLQQIYPGDDYSLEMNGVVIDENSGGRGIPYLTLLLSADNYQSTSPFNTAAIAEILFGNDPAIIDTGNKFRLFRNGQLILEVENLPVYEFESLLYYDLSWETLLDKSGISPPTSNFRDRDSISFIINKKFAGNYQRITGGNTRLNQTFSFDYYTKWVLSDKTLNIRENPQACNCQRTRVDVSGVLQLYVPNNSNLGKESICTGQSYFESFFFLEGYALPLSGEVKTYFKIKELLVPQSGTYRVDSLIIRTAAGSRVYYPAGIKNGYIYFDVNQTTYAGFFKTGDLLINKTLLQCLEKEYKNPSEMLILLDVPPDYQYLIRDTISIDFQHIYTLPDYAAEFELKNITSLSARFSINFKISQKAQTQSKAPYLFIKPVFNAAELKNLRLFVNGIEIQPHPADNNFYFIPAAAISNILITGISQSCNTANIRLLYGPVCDIPLREDNNPCIVKSEQISLNFPKGLIELIPPGQTQTFPLCSSGNEVQLEIFNAGSGHIYQPAIYIRLPQGLHIIPGSTRMIIPGMEDQPITLADGQITANGEYFWILDALLPDLFPDGLPGIQSFPLNRVFIRFNFRTDCDFISGSRILYTAASNHICGTPTNVIRRYGAPMWIQGVQPPANVSLQFSAPDSVLCDEVAKWELQFVKEESEGAVLILEFPQDIRIDSLFADFNLPADSITKTPDKIIAALPGQISSGRLIIHASGFASLSCGTQFLRSFIAARSVANCISTGENCPVLALGAEQIRAFTVRKPQLSIDSFYITADNSMPGMGKAHIIIRNTGNTVAGPVNLIYFRDINNNGTFDTPDIQIRQLLSPSIKANEVLKLEFETDLSAVYCRSGIWLSQDDCLCNPILKFPDTPIPVSQKDVTICTPDMISVGVNFNPGHSYVWENHPKISCNFCNVNTVSLDESDNMRQIQLRLTESDTDGCRYTHYFNIHPEGKPVLLTRELQICKGDSTFIFFSGTNAMWTGPDILTIRNNFIVVAPATNTTYYWTATNPSGNCTATDSIRITVQALPPLYKKYEWCKGAVAMMDISELEPFGYNVISGAQNLDLSKPFAPVIINQENRLYEFRFNNGYCDRILQVEVIFVRPDNFPDSISYYQACIGDTVMITLDESLFYSWDSNAAPPCPDLHCYRFTVSAGTQEEKRYYALIKDKNGCVADVTLIVRFDDSSLLQEQITTCEGQPYMVHGILRDQSGLYCDTVITGNGCLKIHCVDLNFLPVSSSYEERSLCKGDSIVLFGNVIYTSGLYCQNFINQSGCDSTACVRLQVQEALLPPGFTTYYSIAEGENLQLTVPGQYLSYRWMPATGLSCSDCPDPVFNGNSSSSYTLELVDADGCKASILVNIEVRKRCKEGGTIVLPNGFSPNGDGVNDFYLLPVDEFCSPLRVTVFNVWGNIVYSNPRYDNSWKGQSDKGPDLPQGTYYLLLEWPEENIKRTTFVDIRRN